MDQPPRIPPIEPADWDDAMREALAPVTRHTGDAFNIFKTFAHHPEALKAFLAWGSYVLGASTLPAREREIVILRVGWLAQSAYEWAQHVKIGRSCGLTDEEIAAIREGAKAARWTEAERALLDAADQLYINSAIDDPTWAALSKAFSTRQCMDVVFTVGQYTQVCMILKTFRVPLDEGLEGF